MKKEIIKNQIKIKKININIKIKIKIIKKNIKNESLKIIIKK